MTRSCCPGWLGVARIVLAVLVGARGLAAGGEINGPSSDAVKAAFLYNFAQFTVWPALPAGTPIVFCVVGSNAIAGALGETVKGQIISGHALEVRRMPNVTTWQACQLLFIAEAEMGRSTAVLSEIKTQPILTISDGEGFSRSGGIVELFVADERIRFAINIDTAERAKLRLSSRLLGLAKIVRNPNGQ